MKRQIISMILLALALCAGTASALYIRAADRRIQYLCDAIREEALRGEDTSEEVEALCAYWEKCCGVLAYIENSGNVANITAEISRLPAMTADDTVVLLQQTDAVSTQCRLMTERHLPYPRSIM